MMMTIRFRPSMTALLLLLALLQCHLISIQASTTTTTTTTTDHARVLQEQQQQQEVGVRGSPFSTHQELTDAVDVYLEYHYGDQTAQAAASVATAATTILTDYEQLLDTYGPIEYWDVSRLDNFANLFNAKRNPLAAVATLDLSQWNLGHNMDLPIYLQDMFLGAAQMDFDVSYWKTDRVIHFNGMFENAAAFRGMGLESWNVANGELFMSMLSGCTGLHRNLDLSSWELRSAERLDAMFRNSAYGGSVGGDLCSWNEYLRSSATTANMFLQSECVSTADPNLLQRHDPNVELSICSPCDKSTMTSGAAKANGIQPNILLIMTDQQRYDAIRHVQNELEHYNDAYKIQTPNIDRLLQSGAYFRNAYVSIF
jgi:Mycoplasma protein of unknown function, DUF285